MQKCYTSLISGLLGQLIIPKLAFVFNALRYGLLFVEKKFMNYWTKESGCVMDGVGECIKKFNAAYSKLSFS